MSGNLPKNNLDFRTVETRLVREGRGPARRAASRSVPEGFRGPVPWNSFLNTVSLLPESVEGIKVIIIRPTINLRLDFTISQVMDSYTCGSVKVLGWQRPVLIKKCRGKCQEHGDTNFP